tara:strand:+ start:8575 stop:10005 length:1431 start_codon:yes stop_codon:yes gene_type:complete
VVNSFNDDLIKLIRLSNDIESKIQLTRFFGETNSFFDMGVYESKILENEIVKFFISKVPTCTTLKPDNIKKNTLHVISTPYVTGGHTRLCERLAVMESIKPDILVTRYLNEISDSVQRLNTFFESNYYVDAKSSMEKQILQNMRFLINYKNVVLHIHQDDICLVVALGILRKYNPINVFFVNHADHCFSFGDSVTDVKLQISARGYLLDKERIDKEYISSFIGIPLKVCVDKLEFQDRPVNFMMAGSSWKMKPNKYGSSPQIVDHILTEIVDSKFIIVGTNIYWDYWWWKILFKYGRRVSFFNEIEYNKYMEITAEADACVDTCPVVGGTAFVELCLQGLKPFGVLSGISGYTPLDIVKSENVFNVLNQKIPTSIFENIIETHDFFNVRKKYLDAKAGRYHELPKSLLGNGNDMDLFKKGKRIYYSWFVFRLFFRVKYNVKFSLIPILLKHFSYCSLIRLFFSIIPKFFRTILKVK